MNATEQELKGQRRSGPPQTKWGPAVTGRRNGYQLLPDVLIRNQRLLRLNCTELVVLVNILMHWWESEPENLPHPRPEQIATRMGATPRTVQRCIAKLTRLGLIEWLPTERTPKGLAVRRFKLDGLLRTLQAYAELSERHDELAV